MCLCVYLSATTTATKSVIVRARRMTTRRHQATAKLHFFLSNETIYLFILHFDSSQNSILPSVFSQTKLRFSNFFFRILFGSRPLGPISHVIYETIPAYIYAFKIRRASNTTSTTIILRGKKIDGGDIATVCRVETCSLLPFTKRIVSAATDAKN